MPPCGFLCSHEIRCKNTFHIVSSQWCLCGAKASSHYIIEPNHEMSPKTSEYCTFDKLVLCFIYRYFVHKLAGSLPLSMRWLGRYTDNSNTGRALVFFNTVAELASVYSLVTSEIRDTKAIQMYHQSTPDSVKSSILDDMAKPDGNIKVLLCSTSLSMGLNLCNINLAICVGPPESAEMFLQETGRVARHSSTRGQGIVLTFKGMTRRVTNMKDFLEGVMCKRTSLLKELGEVVTTRLDSCCDICTTDAVSMLADYVCNVSDDISEPITT